jgi:phospholipid/cholesterol/gamma-HCH transport system substrate-binding protein
VEIDGGSATTPVLEHKMFGEYPVIQSKQSTLQALENQAPQILDKINKIADRLNRVLSDQNIKSISDTLTNIKVTTDVFNKRSGDIDKTLHNLATGTDQLNVDLGDLHGVMGSANTTLSRIDHLAGDADAAVNGAQLDELSTQLRQLATSLSRLSNGLQREPTSLIFGDRRKGYTPQ